MGCFTFHGISDGCRTLLAEREYLDIPEQHIPLIMESIDNIVLPNDRRR